jgi:hypothetical protein
MRGTKDRSKILRDLGKWRLEKFLIRFKIVNKSQ